MTKITTEMLMTVGCVCLNGKAFDVKGGMAASFDGEKWMPFGPRSWTMRLLHKYGGACYSPENEKPTFKVKAISA